MKNEEITDSYYKKAVEKLGEATLQDKDVWYSHILNLPEHLQVTYTVIIVDQQVFNGGFHQYFFNSYGQFAYLTIDNLRLIGAFKAADILERATNLVNADQISLNEFRRKVFDRDFSKVVDFDDELFDALSALDDEYYALEENLEQLLVDYLSNQ
ncbi:DMP19 family protein [Sphingobacterium siyangense]|uniref:DMP19 family protein n=1 Tax=Sphingobacterium siyangense TaxID=459529 RepID=UPI003DA1CBDA